MDIKSEILKEHSKKQTIKIAEYIGDDPEKFSVLMELFLDEDYRISQRASWIVSYCATAFPDLLKPHLKHMVKNLNKPVHDAVKRNTIRILQHITIPKSLHGSVANICFTLLSNKKEPVAIKAFAMTVIYRISLTYPSLENELKILIEDQLITSSAAFRSRGNKILDLLKGNESSIVKNTNQLE